MITHVVLMKFKAEGRAAAVETARQKLLDMVGRVPSLRQLEVGINCVPSARACDLSLITRFDDLRGLEEYAVDPVHVAVKDYLATVLEAAYVVDSSST